MSESQPIYQLEGDRVFFPTLRNISGLEAKEVRLEAPKSFAQPNEHSGLRSVGSLDEVCDIARQAAQGTVQRLKS